jgi:hypothetical protein
MPANGSVTSLLAIERPGSPSLLVVSCVTLAMIRDQRLFDAAKLILDRFYAVGFENLSAADNVGTELLPQAR